MNLCGRSKPLPYNVGRSVKGGILSGIFKASEQRYRE